MHSTHVITIAAISFLTLAACDPLYQGWENVTRTTIEGTDLIVQKDERQEKTYAATLDPTALTAVRNVDLQRKNVLAIEAVTGCSVVPATIFTDTRTVTTYANVDC